jgi:hypothetical protein
MTEKYTLQSIGLKLALHIAGDQDRDVKTDAMYKMLVTGNGVPSMSETLRLHTSWIDAHKERDKEKRRQNFEYKLLAAGQIIALIAGIVIVYLKVK